MTSLLFEPRTPSNALQTEAWRAQPSPTSKAFAYSVPDEVRDLSASPIVTALLLADDAVTRLDERLAVSTLTGGLAERLILHNARAVMHARHRIVYLEELVLFDAHAYDGPVHTEIAEAAGIVQSWRRAQRADANDALSTPRPGEPAASLREVERDPDVAAMFDPAHNMVERLAAWRETFAATAALPPILAAAIAWDAWLAISPEERGEWRGALIAALMLRARGKFRNLLLPFDIGARLVQRRWTESDDRYARLCLLLEIIGTTARQVAKEHDTLLLAEQLLRRRLTTRRRNSKLPAVVDLLLSRPLVTRRMIASSLGVSKQAAAVMIEQLGPTVRELTDRRSYRCWGI